MFVCQKSFLCQAEMSFRRSGNNNALNILPGQYVIKSQTYIYIWILFFEMGKNSFVFVADEFQYSQLVIIAN